MLRGTGAAVGDAIFLQPCNKIAVDASDPKARIYFSQHTLWELSLALLPPVPGRCLEFCTTYVLCQAMTRLIAICCQGAQTRHFISHLHFPAPCSGTAWSHLTHPWSPPLLSQQMDHMDIPSPAKWGSAVQIPVCSTGCSPDFSISTVWYSGAHLCFLSMLFHFLSMY